MLEKTTNKLWYCLCEGLIGPQYLQALGNNKDEIMTRVTSFVLGQLNVLPLSLQIAMQIGIYTFCMYVFILTLKPIGSLPISQRTHIIETWASGRIALTRKLFRPIRSLTVLAFFDQPEVISLLNQKNKYDPKQFD